MNRYFQEFDALRYAMSGKVQPTDANAPIGQEINEIMDADLWELFCGILRPLDDFRAEES